MASCLHQGQRRKGSGEPYLSHLMGVASLVIRYDGTDTEAAGALLHDAAEDCGGEETLDRISREIGLEVADIVRGCSDCLETPKPPWRKRKEAFIRSLQDASPSVILVSNCDKIYNLGTILDDFRNEGEAVWKRFTGKKDNTLWYYRTLTKFYLESGKPAPAEKLSRIMQALEKEI